MPAISTRSLAFVQKSVTRFLTSYCLIEQKTLSVDQFGAQLNTWRIVAANVPCRLISIGGRFRTSSGIVADEVSMRDSYRLIVGNSVPLSVGMRITVNGLRFDVANIQQSDTDSVMSEAFVTRQRGDQP